MDRPGVVVPGKGTVERLLLQGASTAVVEWSVPQVADPRAGARGSGTLRVDGGVRTAASGGSTTKNGWRCASMDCEEKATEKGRAAKWVDAEDGRRMID